MKASTLLAVLLAAAAIFWFMKPTHSEENPPPPPAATATPKVEANPKDNAAMTSKTYTRPSDDEIKKKLTPIQYRVTQQHGTEPPFQNEFHKSKDIGLYVDIVSGEPLFSSKDKFDSGTGWPSFTQPIVSKNIVEVVDTSHGMRRVEVRSKYADSHLGHVFNDGPKPTGMRYCINSAAMRFIPADKLDAEGYGEFKAAVGAVSEAKAGDIACPVPGKMGLGLPPGCEATMEVAILAGGCFWGMEDIIRKVPGVIDTDVGYTGGTTEKPTYNDIKTGRTGHAEALKVVYDPKKITYAELLEKWFFKMHDPTTKNRQGNDVGTQYRSAIFYTSDAQKKVAEEVIQKVDKSGKWKRPIVTEVVAASDFTIAEGYHQDYLVKNPNGYTCHFMRE